MWSALRPSASALMCVLHFPGDLFDMLLPMLSIYQEYVRNHHYSLQVLTECKSNANFATVLKRLEGEFSEHFFFSFSLEKVFSNLFLAKPQCQNRSLETFLTYPMHQIPRYIITLHELLAHTPHDHVERKSLQNARQQLEDLSRWCRLVINETLSRLFPPPSFAGKCTTRYPKRKISARTWPSNGWLSKVVTFYWM